MSRWICEYNTGLKDENGKPIWRVEGIVNADTKRDACFKVFGTRNICGAYRIRKSENTESPK